MNRRVGVGSGKARVVEGVEMVTYSMFALAGWEPTLRAEIFGRPKSHSNRHVRPVSAAAAGPIGFVRDDRDCGLDLIQYCFIFDG